MHKHRRSIIEKVAFTVDNLDRLVRVVERGLSPEHRKKFQQRRKQFRQDLQIVARNASSPLPADQPGVDATGLGRLEEAAAKFIELVRVHERDLFAAKLGNPNRTVFVTALIGAQFGGQHKKHWEWLDRLTLGVSCVQGLAAVAAAAASASIGEGKRGTNKTELPDLLMDLVHVRCLATGEEPPAKKSEARQNFGPYLVLGCELLDVPADRRSLSKLVDCYWGNGRRTQGEAKIRRRERLMHRVEMAENARRY
jgi:hypothetical protein